MRTECSKADLIVVADGARSHLRKSVTACGKLEQFVSILSASFPE